MDMSKKLYPVPSPIRSSQASCGGIAEYFHIDSTLVRVIMALAACMGWGIVFYIICIFVIPLEP